VKTVQELESAMSSRYAGPTAVIRKGSQERTYIPWPAMIRHLDSVFGWDGWGARIVSVVANGDTYTVALDFEVYAFDERTNTIRTIPRPGVSGTLVRGEDGSDAAGGARSLALVNGARSLGDAFGLYLTPDRSEVAPSNGHTPPLATGEAASEAQVMTLRKCRVPENLIRTATKVQAGAFFDHIFPDKKTGAYKHGRKFTNEEALQAAFGVELVPAGDDFGF